MAHHESAPERPLSRDDSSQPIVVMPGTWRTYCSGCHVPAPETEPHDASWVRSTAGCRCLMCPNWFACPACAEKEALAHQAAHSNEVHVTYLLSPEDEKSVLDAIAASATIPRWRFTLDSLVLPFLKMFVPCVSVLFQVAMPRLRALPAARFTFNFHVADVYFSDQRALHRFRPSRQHFSVFSQRWHVFLLYWIYWYLYDRCFWCLRHSDF